MRLNGLDYLSMIYAKSALKNGVMTSSGRLSMKAELFKVVSQ